MPADVIVSCDITEYDTFEVCIDFVERITENSIIRITEDGITLIIE